MRRRYARGGLLPSPFAAIWDGRPESATPGSVLESEQRVAHRERGAGGAAHEIADVAGGRRRDEHPARPGDVPAHRGDGALGRLAPAVRHAGLRDGPSAVVDLAATSAAAD